MRRHPGVAVVFACDAATRRSSMLPERAVSLGHLKSSSLLSFDQVASEVQRYGSNGNISLSARTKSDVYRRLENEYRRGQSVKLTGDLHHSPSLEHSYFVIWWHKPP